MSEQFKLTKKRIIWLVILCVILFLYNLYAIFKVEDWSSFRPYRLFFICFALIYAIYFFIKKYKESE